MPERPPPQHIRVFLSSPGDVADERALARRLLKEELPYDPLVRGRVTFDVVSWDDPDAPSPMPATLAPQEAVNRFGPKPSECDVVVVVLWSRMGTHLGLEAFRKPDGGPYLSGTEWEFEDARNADPPPNILVYRRTEELMIGVRDPARAEKFRQWDLVEQFFAGFQNPDGSSGRGWTDYYGPTEFKDRLAGDLKRILREQYLRDGPGPDPGATKRGTYAGLPYPGLRAFTSDQASIFFGRGREVDALVARLRDPAQRFLAVVGASGTGKSSLVRAGLLPRLKDGALEGSRHWPVLAVTPGAYGDNPLLALAAEMKNTAPAHAQEPPVRIAEALARAPQRPLEFAGTLLAGRPAGAALVLFVDQLEELFTLAAERHRGAFIQLLARAAGDPRLRVLATLRADFLPQAAAEPVLAPLLRAGTFVLGSPGPAALADMIRRPAERVGLALEEGLADAILKDAGSDPGEALPLIAFCLEELYRRSDPGHRLTLDAYRATGGLRGVIGRRAEELLRKASAEGVDLDAALPPVFRALVHVDATGQPVRRRAPLDALKPAHASIPPLVETLTKGRLLLAEEAGGSAVVVLAHEALVHEWPALCTWLQCHRDQMQRVQRHLLGLAAAERAERVSAAGMLGEIGLAAAGAAPALAAAVAGDADREVRRAAAKALERMGPAAAGAAPALAAAVVGDADREVRRAAAKALEEMGPAAAGAVPTLSDALTAADWEIQQAAVVVLGKIGLPAMPALAGALAPGAATAVRVRRIAVRVVGNIAQEAPETAVPALAGALRDADHIVRLDAVSALREIGLPAAPALAAALEDRAGVDREARQAAAVALGRMGQAAAAAIWALAAALRGAEWEVRRAAEEALEKIGPAAVPALVDALRDPEWKVRRAAAEALGKIGPAAAAAVPALVDALRDPEWKVRRAAGAALRRIKSDST